MAESLFKPFKKRRGYLKMLVYGEPGTTKTRRALQMPGPIYMIDMENGAADYGDLVDPARDFYLGTKSHTQVAAAVRELIDKPEGTVGTCVIDPITQLWQSIQSAHVERMCQRKSIRPEDVHFDVGTWSRLKRFYGDVLSDLISAPFHVVMTARGREKINEKGARLGYGYDGEKTTIFLANVVVESHYDSDVVIKDRTGTYAEATRRPRIAFTDFLERTGTDQARLQRESDAANQDAASMDGRPIWSPDEERAFLEALRGLGMRFSEVSAYCQSVGRPHPAWMAGPQRRRLIEWLGQLRDHGQMLPNARKTA